MFDEAINSRGYRRLWPAKRLKAYRDSLRELPGNRQVCATTVTLPQNLLLAEQSSMDHIIEAIRKIQDNAEALTKA
jgi:5-methylcytosine-specific restriction endonuclease McrA